MNLNYETDIEIDESALDIEWLSQPSLMLKYGQASAHAMQNMEIAKERREVIRCELDKNIRLNQDKYEVTKITDKVVECAIKIQPEYQAASDKYIEAKHEADLIKAAVQAFDQRKAALENLVRLHGQQYFAGPSVPRDLSKEWAEQQKQDRVDTGIAKHMMKRKKNKEKEL